MASETLVSLFAARVAAKKDAVALRSKRNGVWETVTWGEWDRRARAVAATLIAAGLRPGERVALYANTREEWVIADLAVMMAGGVSVPLYQTLIGEQAAYILDDSESRFLIADDPSYVVRLLDDAIRPALDRLVAIYLFEETRPVDAPHHEAWRAPSRGAAPQDADVRALADLPADVRTKVSTFAEAMAAGRQHAEREPGAVEARIRALEPGAVATIMYTSGTTGNPKGVMLTHASFAFETAALAEALGIRESDEELLFLPMAHIFARIMVAVQLRVGCVTTFAESLMKAMDNALEVNPTIMGCVPRLYEKLFVVANEKILQEGGIKRSVFDWAIGIGRQVARLRESGAKVEGLLKFQHHYADKLVLSRIRARFGKRLRLAISGGAPLSRELGEWFHGSGITVLEGYGLTETCAATNVNVPGAYRFGSVGKALPGVDVKVAADGEVLVRGPNLMVGYFGKSSDTRDAIDADGWLHTGDIGVIDPDGFLTITDRKKDMVVTAGGKNVAPQNIENLLKQSPWISQAMVYGDRRPYLVALVTLNADAMERFAEETGRPFDLAALAVDPEVRARIELEVNAVNRKLSQFETIKAFAIPPRDLTVDAGELTPTLKIKRKVVADRFRHLLEALYDRPSRPSP